MSEDYGFSGFLAFGVLALFVLLLAGINNSAYDRGFDAGVRAHAEGRYVVVDMPDGTKQVCKAKEAPDAK